MAPESRHCPEGNRSARLSEKCPRNERVLWRQEDIARMAGIVEAIITGRQPVSLTDLPVIFSATRS